MSIRAYLKKFPLQTGVTVVGPMPCDTAELTEPCIFVDGGTRHRTTEYGISVGDGDSAEIAMDVKLHPHKDLSDLAYVLRNLPHQIRTVRLSGFVGGRIDHQLFNFGEAHLFLKNRPHDGKIDFDDAITGYAAGRWQFVRHGLFSVMAIEACDLTLTGECRYQVDPAVNFAPLNSLGLSNYGNGCILLQCQAPVFVLNS